VTQLFFLVDGFLDFRRDRRTREDDDDDDDDDDNDNDDDDDDDDDDDNDDELIGPATKEPRQVWQRSNPLVEFKDAEFQRHFRY
jgi:hypothetical protein